MIWFHKSTFYSKTFVSFYFAQNQIILQFLHKKHCPLIHPNPISFSDLQKRDCLSFAGIQICNRCSHLSRRKCQRILVNVHCLCFVYLLCYYCSIRTHSRYLRKNLSTNHNLTDCLFVDVLSCCPNRRISVLETSLCKRNYVSLRSPLDWLSLLWLNFITITPAAGIPISAE